MNGGIILSEDKAAMPIICCCGDRLASISAQMGSLWGLSSTNQALRSKRGNSAITHIPQSVTFFASSFYVGLFSNCTNIISYKKYRVLNYTPSIFIRFAFFLMRGR